MKNKMMKGKKGMLPRDILLSIVVFSAFMTGAFYIAGGMFHDYGIPYSDNSSLYNKLDSMSSQTTTMKTSLENSGTSVVGDILLFPRGVWESIKLTFSAGDIIKTIVEQIGNDYNIPSFLIYAFMTMLIITIVFGILSAVMRKKT